MHIVMFYPLSHWFAYIFLLLMKCTSFIDYFCIELGIWLLYYLYFLWFVNSLIAAFICESFYLAFQILFSNILSWERS